MAKYLKVGSLIGTVQKDGTKRLSIGLGVKGKNSQYDLSVEVIVRDPSGKIVSRQTDGFINLQDPRTEADELLRAGVISEDLADKMRENSANVPEKIKYVLKMPTVS